MDFMHKCEGYWVSREIYDVVEYRVGGTKIAGYGSPGVRFNSEAFGPIAPKDSILVTFGGSDLHSSGGLCPDLVMPVESAVSLISLLRAAVTDALIAEGQELEPIPFVDVTAEKCTCPYCAYMQDRS
ncbi:hypothetical protein [Nocardia australiensis]|uniref:hypothetical protein n=1 Tax=Nocardia australiensis TaxID=2887191 RepID=UPI001D13ABCE|nr:hypothetical protein [Nocardia australiensis]